MGLQLTITYWLFMYQLWIIIGLGLVALEITDGGAIFFLPMGLAAFCMSGLLLLSDYELLPLALIPNAWYWLIAIWMFLAVIFSFLITLRGLSKNGKDDINNY